MGDGGGSGKQIAGLFHAKRVAHLQNKGAGWENAVFIELLITMCLGCVIPRVELTQQPRSLSADLSCLVLKVSVSQVLYLMSQKAFGRVACTARAAGRGNTQPFQTPCEP